MKLISAAAIAALAGSASASLIVDGNMAFDTLDFTNVDVGSAAFVVGQLQKFDESLGPLLRVTLTLDATVFDGSITHDNEGGNPSEVTLGIGAEVQATAMGAPAATALVAIPVVEETAMVDADNDGDADFVGSDSFTIDGGEASDSDTKDSIDDSFPVDFFIAAPGDDTFDVELDPRVFTFLSTDGGFGPIDPNPGLTSGTVTVKYTFVPSPGATGLVTIAGLVALRRRRG
ncbi:MAG: choice-of-anchor E domain-containing protein [Planctomycetota bacterium]